MILDWCTRGITIEPVAGANARVRSRVGTGCDRHPPPVVTSDAEQARPVRTHIWAET